MATEWCFWDCQAKRETVEEMELYLREEREKFDASFSTLDQRKAENAYLKENLQRTQESLVKTEKKLKE